MKPDLLKNKKVINAVESVGLPLLFGVIMVTVWQYGILHAILGLTDVQLPRPSKILTVIRANFETIVSDTEKTVYVMFVGLVIGSFIGFLTALLATVSPRWGFGGLTVLSAFNAIPIVALSPVMRLWFADSPTEAKIAVVSLVSMVAVSVNAHRGLNDLKPFSLDLMKSYGASKVRIFFTLRLPSCVPSLFTAFKINISVSVISAIISEYFASSTVGLGYRIKDSFSTSQITSGWAYIVVASLIGIVLYMALMLCELSTKRFHSAHK